MVGTGSLRIAVLVACVTGAVAATRVLLAAEERAAEEAIKPGDTVKVVKGPAPLMLGTKKLTDVEEGSEHRVLKVSGKWVQLRVEQADMTYTGWVDATTHLDRAKDHGEGASADVTGAPQRSPTTPAKVAIPKEMRWAWIVAKSGVFPLEAEVAAIIIEELRGRFTEATDDQRFCFYLKFAQPPPTKKIGEVADMVGQPDRVEKSVKARLEGVDVAFDDYWYGPLYLRVCPNTGLVAGISGPRRWLLQGIRAKAEAALKGGSP